MATYKRFEDLQVWQNAAELFDACDDFLAEAPARVRPSFRNHLERAVLSVSNNVAEGFERGTTSELLAFIYIARGSSGEVRSMIALLARRPWATGLKPQLTKLIVLAESCSRQLRGWADSLQNADIQGQRHLNARSRKEWQRKKADEKGTATFQGKQREIVSKLAADHPFRRSWEEKHGPLQASQSQI